MDEESTDNDHRHILLLLCNCSRRYFDDKGVLSIDECRGLLLKLAMVDDDEEPEHFEEHNWRSESRIVSDNVWVKDVTKLTLMTVSIGFTFLLLVLNVWCDFFDVNESVRVIRETILDNDEEDDHFDDLFVDIFSIVQCNETRKKYARI